MLLKAEINVFPKLTYQQNIRKKQEVNKLSPKESNKIHFLS